MHSEELKLNSADVAASSTKIGRASTIGWPNDPVHDDTLVTTADEAQPEAADVERSSGNAQADLVMPLIAVGPKSLAVRAGPNRMRSDCRPAPPLGIDGCRQSEQGGGRQEN
jgi:hypothetical protein